MNGDLTIWSFYSFVKIDSPDLLVPKLLLICKKKSIKGTILLAEEGFNGYLAGERQNVQLAFDKLLSLTGAKDPIFKVHKCDFIPFDRLKIKVKKEIVRFDVDGLDIEKQKGQYVKPHDWDSLISNKDTVVIDVRNDYEVEMGSFKGAINPRTRTFRQFAAWTRDHLKELRGKKVAMFCTGGIRCEKSTAYLKSLGHNDVYHLEGGILQYLEDKKGSQDMTWSGKCFVFDDRVSVDKDLKSS